MRFPIYDDVPVAGCDLCGGELYRDETAYRINGETICPDCLADYARQVFSLYTFTVGREAER